MRDLEEIVRMNKVGGYKKEYSKETIQQMDDFIKNFETQEEGKSLDNKHKQNEVDFIDIFNHSYPKYRLEQFQNPYARIDFVVLEGKGRRVAGFMEYKHRQFDHNKYETILIDHVKMKELRFVRDQSNVPVYLVNHHTDGLYIYEITGEIFPLEFGGVLKDKKEIKLIEKMPHQKFRSMTGAFDE